MQTSVQIDPLNSPYPIPWNWITATLAESDSSMTPYLRYYRTSALVSPDGQYAAYSRIQMQVMPEWVYSRVHSVLFIENLQTGDLQTIMATSPFANNPFAFEAEAPQVGAIAILIPVAWSESGDRILAREFESLFGTDIASDYAVIWEKQGNRVRTIAPTGIQYTNAILMGWSRAQPNHVLFQTGNLGDERWQFWTVDFTGQTLAAGEHDQPLTFGQPMDNLWTGPQAYILKD